LAASSGPRKLRCAGFMRKSVSPCLGLFFSAPLNLCYYLRATCPILPYHPVPGGEPYLLVAGFSPFGNTATTTAGNYFQYVRRMVMSDAGGFESNRLLAPAGAATLINSVSFSASTWPAALHFPVRRATCMDGGVTNTDTGPALALLKSTQLVGAPPKPVG
jgi:hypothetical protein